LKREIILSDSFLSFHTAAFGPVYKASANSEPFQHFR